MNNNDNIETEIVHMEEIKEVKSNASLCQPSNDEFTEDDLNLPHMNITVPTSHQQPEQAPVLISDEEYLGFLDEIMTNIRDDRKQVSDYLDNFADMVINSGDATTSSKEALVNLVKLKLDLQDKMLKTADLMTRVKLKNTYAYSGPHLNAMQQNNFISTDSDVGRKERKELIRAINQAKKKK